ncbi:MAG: hypothetical protein KME49_27415 [Brasilonema octagenarum HA4186-MV1]|nr:hypothetical protein [Brasilonema octagenarum HA4186-MV1]
MKLDLDMGYEKEFEDVGRDYKSLHKQVKQVEREYFEGLYGTGRKNNRKKR